MRGPRRFLFVSLIAVLATSCARTVAPAASSGTGAPATSPAASPAEVAAVTAVVRRMFDGMRARDTAMMASVFHPDARFYALNQNGVVNVIVPSTFIQGIARARPGVVLDEVIQDVEVRIDGPLAIVWTYYDFFAGEQFSHCGYDAYLLLKESGAWKIVALADSRRQEGCRQRRR